MREGLVVACAGMKRTDPCVSSGIELPRNSGYSSFRGLVAQAAGVMEGPWPTNPHHMDRSPLDRLGRSVPSLRTGGRQPSGRSSPMQPMPTTPPLHSTGEPSPPGTITRCWGPCSCRPAFASAWPRERPRYRTWSLTSWSGS